MLGGHKAWYQGISAVQALCEECLWQIVHKPAEQTPMTSLALAELGRRAGLPDGVFNVVSGDSVAIGEPTRSFQLHAKPRPTGHRS